MQATLAPTWGVTYTESNRWYVHLLPSLTDFAFLLPLFLLFVMLPGTRILFSDGDTGWHLRTGEWILQHKLVPTIDLFSFSKPHQPWFAWEWGWDVMFAGINKFWGLGGVALINVLLLGLISALLFRLIRRCCDNDALAFAFTLACDLRFHDPLAGAAPPFFLAICLDLLSRNCFCRERQLEAALLATVADALLDEHPWRLLHWNLVAARQRSR